MTIIAGIMLVLAEGWYWLIYFPRAWRTPGTNQEIDTIRYLIKGGRS